MDADRDVALLAHPDQWARCRHEQTTLAEGGGVQLDWADTDAPGPAPAGDPRAGLAFDRWCRAYRSRPDLGRVDVDSPGHGGFLRVPRGLAVDRAQRLYVCETGAGAVHVADLWAQRLLRRIPLRTDRHRHRRPVDVAACSCGCGVLVLTQNPAGLLRLDGRRAPRPGPGLIRPRCRGAAGPIRVAAGPLILWRCAGGRPNVIAHPDGTVLLTVDRAADLDVTPDDTLIVARAPGEPFLRFALTAARVDGGLGSNPEFPRWGGVRELEPVAAPGWDGGAIAVAPDGRVAYTTRAGHNRTAGAAARHHRSGRVVSYRLDSGNYRTRWGRLFVDACLPVGTGVTAQFVTTDEDDVTDPVAWLAAGRGPASVPHAELTPPLPSEIRLATLPAEGQRLYRRPTGREWPWAQIPAGDGFETYETPVDADPGRYLWVILNLTGTRAATPRVREARIERPGHRLLRHLPRAWSRAEPDAAFLQRYLAPAEGLLHELDQRAAHRDVLVDPRTAPQETLNWLSSMAGVVLDRRWPEPARRTLLAEVFALYRRRGTRGALLRILEIYLGVRPALVETWQLRGLGGVLLGTQPGGLPSPAIGGTSRATGSLGRYAVGGSRPDRNSYSAAAHRFTLLVPGSLDDEQRAVVRSVVEAQKPAHTVVEVCEIGRGMRVGRTHLDLTSVVGLGSGGRQVVVGQVLVGGDGVVGLPASGAQLGRTSVAGKLRVG